MSKLNENSNLLWQKARQGYIHYNDECWYEKSCVGQRSIESFMKSLCKSAKLNLREYTNHSIRATCIGTLDTKGFEAHHITAISSHKSESTIKTYSTKCLEGKKREMYEVLNASVVPNRPKTETISKPQDIQIIQDQGKKSSTINTSDLSDIGINVNLNKNNNSNQEMPPNFELAPFEDDDDDFLLEYLRSNPDNKPEQATVQAPPRMTTTNTMNTMSTSIPVIPRMYFPNSNVTINYNFSK